MGRIHSGDKVKSGSSAPAGKGSPGQAEYKPKEIDAVIVNLANTGMTAAQIGMALRDQYGIPNFKNFSGKKMEQVLKEKELLPDVPRDLLNLIRKSVTLQKHMAENKNDMTSKRGYQLTVSKIRRLVKHYKKDGKLAQDWRYTPESAALLVK